MPELPEVETTRRGIAPHLCGRTVLRVKVHQPRLRWPVPQRLVRELPGNRVERVDRRGKYLLLATAGGSVIIHLGMSGSLRLAPAGKPRGPHDHVEWVLERGLVLRLRDPRRFGAVLWTRRDPRAHVLLRGLGPEPLSSRFNGSYLHRVSQGRRIRVKPFIMDNRVVTGVGNIYANEALFESGIHPGRMAGRIAEARYELLATAIRKVLGAAIRAGGTTLRDFVREDGSPGYFRHDLAVYDRGGLPCVRCGAPLQRQVIGQRSSYFCSICQR